MEKSLETLGLMIYAQGNHISHRFRIKRLFGRPRHPQFQGQVERVQQTISRRLSKILFDKNKIWIEELPQTVYEYNTSFHRAIKSSPFAKYRNRLGFNDTLPLEPIEGEEIESEDPAPLNPYQITQDKQIVHSDTDDHPIQVDTLKEINETQEYRKNYEKSMEKAQSVHLRKLNVLQGSLVLLRKDFDMNPTTRKRKAEI